MNPGLTEEVGKAANSAIAGLSRSPLALAAIIINVLVLGGVFWLVQQAASRQERQFTAIMQSCFEGKK